jgi:hypothetical protein
VSLATGCCDPPGTMRRAGLCWSRWPTSTSSARSRDAIVEALAAAIPTVVIELGDPGVTHDADTPYLDLPAYEGPPDPPAGHTHEWGEDVAEEAGLPPPPDELD